ncbi:hypothetical protein EII29_11855, partial [Leptotrichia sp. OH3620_COT-345]|uniref:hypothetical protein n=1 Tax=Leptotrichia sp. OH3620_COT-345 TaxID=2491048 RepID=UPI000F98B42A
MAISSGDKRVKYDLGLYSQGNIVGLGAFNVLKNNGIYLGKGKGFDLRSYGTPIRRNTLSDFEKPLGIRF